MPVWYVVIFAVTCENIFFAIRNELEFVQKGKLNPHLSIWNLDLCDQIFRT